ncbi:ribose-5-phosphate isomerase RpiA [Planctomycetota bacterium]
MPSSNGPDALKTMAARAALSFVESGGVLGVGTGSTANCFVDLLGREAKDAVPAAVASSQATAERLGAFGIQVIDLNETGSLSVYIDGADEFDPGLSLVKGGGGALTREKIVAEAARLFVCIVDAQKRVDRLGRFPVPVEVIPMARELVCRKLRALGGEPRLREGFETDNGNVILDVSGLVIEDPVALEAEIETYPGVVCCGLFARRRADVVLMATPDGVVRLER